MEVFNASFSGLKKTPNHVLLMAAMFGVRDYGRGADAAGGTWMLAGPSQDFCGTLGTIQMRWESDTNCAKSGNIGPLQRAHLKTPACIVDNCEQALMQETGPWGSLVKPNVSFLTLQFTRSVINFKKNRGDCFGVEEMAIMSFLVRDTCMWDGVYLHVIHSKTDWRILQGAANVAEPGAWNPPYFQWGMLIRPRQISTSTIEQSRSSQQSLTAETPG